jgi:hypothetical protein
MGSNDILKHIFILISPPPFMLHICAQAIEIVLNLFERDGNVQFIIFMV